METFTYELKALAPNCQLYRISQAGVLLSFKEVAKLWRESTEFTEWYTDILAGSPFEAFFWEHPPVTSRTLDQVYEFVLVDSPTLARVTADPSPFQSFFGETLAVSFLNLRGDAQLVAPRPTQKVNFPHLATFCRLAASAQAQAFWQAVGRLFDPWVTSEIRWLSTSGLGVYWLHARWDQRPKYYTHRPYRNAANS